jgi:predicted chitinase
MIKLKHILEQRGNEHPKQILFITDYDINRNWHVFRRLLRSQNITGIFRYYKEEDSSEMVNLLHYNITKSYDFVILQISGLKDKNSNLAIQNYKRAIRLCQDNDVPLIIVAPPYPKFAKELDRNKDLLYFERIDAWLHGVESDNLMMIDLSELDDDVYFAKNGIDLSKTGNDVIYQELIQLIDSYSEEPEEIEPVIEPEEEPEEEPKPIILKQLLKGHVEIVGNVTREQEDNIKLMIQYMNDSDITDPVAQIGILSVIGKESDYVPQTEIGYGGTPNSRIREKFGNRVPSDDDELDELKSDDEKFFNAVYGGRFENEDDEGYLYRGRGFNQLTFKSNYRIYGKKVRKNLVADPDLVNEPDIAAAVAVEFFTKGAPVPEFKSISDAVTYFTNLNAGGEADSENHGSAQRYSKLFKIVP